MDSIHDSIKLEKASAIRNYRQLQKLTNLFRAIEICIILIIISKFSSQLPILIESSCQSFKHFSIVIFSPPCVFLIGNMIIITLFAISGHFSSKDSSKPKMALYIYEELLQKSENINENIIEKHKNCEEKTITVDTCNTTSIASTNLAMKKYRRAKSEKMDTEIFENGRILRRTKTENSQKSEESDENWVKRSFIEDNLSNEEFKRAVDVFIARQQRLRREEEDYSAFAIE